MVISDSITEFGDGNSRRRSSSSEGSVSKHPGDDFIIYRASLDLGTGIVFRADLDKPGSNLVQLHIRYLMFSV